MPRGTSVRPINVDDPPPLPQAANTRAVPAPLPCTHWLAVIAAGVSVRPVKVDDPPPPPPAGSNESAIRFVASNGLVSLGSQIATSKRALNVVSSSRLLMGLRRYQRRRKHGEQCDKPSHKLNYSSFQFGSKSPAMMAATCSGLNALPSTASRRPRQAGPPC